MLIEFIKDNKHPSDDELNEDDDVRDEELEPALHLGRTLRTLVDLTTSWVELKEFISSVSHVVLGKPFVELSDMTYNSLLGIVRLTNGNEKIAYKTPYKIEQYDSLSNDENENMKSVYLRNVEDKKKGVEYVMSKILGFYKEFLELGPEYRTGQEESSSGASENHGGVT
nr:protein kinase-like domain, concanavalin A-like lectin/glucanase domain protein [Tanacetum cinerariifolium]GEX70751.1 protein kinase-like domain, concanavalin A-like lectin/glucanase domain protein [Tanacetum cinerariifolium]